MASQTAVIQRQPASPPARLSDTAAIIQMIERVALNPNADIDKMERLLQMQERVFERNARAAYTEALASMQQELPVINERGGIKNNAGRVQSTYALWEDINEAIKPALTKYGFALTFRTGEHDGRVTVTGILSHKDGHREETTMHLPTDTSGSKNAVQAIGSSTSYGKRYTAAALLNLTSRGEDDDGKRGTGELLSPKQLEEVRDLITMSGANEPKFCAYMKVGAIAELRADQFEAAIAALNRYAGKRQIRGRS